MSLLDSLDQTGIGLCLELGLGRRAALRPKLLSHFRIRKLASSSASTVAVALLACRMQPRTTSRRLVRARCGALGAAPMLFGAPQLAEPLSSITRWAHPYLAPAAHARRQSPGLLGGQSPAEVRRFLDDTLRLRDTHYRWRNISARSPEGSGGNPGLHSFSAR
jgi:hypothetical protein